VRLGIAVYVVSFAFVNPALPAGTVARFDGLWRQLSVQYSLWSYGQGAID
jgi:hypothetical protein